MKPTLLLFLCLLIKITVHAQFDPEKYFTDSISFSYEVCRPVAKKELQQGIKPCTPYKYSAIASFTDFSVTEDVEYSKKNPESKDIRTYAKGKLSSIDFDKSPIVKHTEYSAETTTIPAEFYELRLHADTYKPKFTSKGPYFPEATALSIYMYFASEADAQAAKDYLLDRKKAGGW